MLYEYFWYLIFEFLNVKFVKIYTQQEKSIITVFILIFVKKGASTVSLHITFLISSQASYTDYEQKMPLIFNQDHCNQFF